MTRSRRHGEDTTGLAKKIAHLRADESGERNLYPLMRDLLITPAFGIGLKADQVVVDSALAGGRDVPDLTVFSTRNGRPIKTPDHAYAVFELKRGRELSHGVTAIYEEKKKYIKAGTRWFFILDQEEVHRWDVMAGLDASVHRWEDLVDPERFADCFGELRPDRVDLENQLKAFREGRTKYAYQSIERLGKRHFTDTVREIAAILSTAVAQLVDSKVANDLRVINGLVSNMEITWGPVICDWASASFPIEFTKMVDEEAIKELSHAQLAEYADEHDRFAAAAEPCLYALRIEKQVLAEYAERMGAGDGVSLLKPRRSRSKLTDSGKVVESFIYETASLIVSRMLMVRFSEDHGFLKRYISNGGVEVFARYADYYSKPMQALLRETYRQSAELYRNLFDQSILDWALDSSDENLSSTLLHAMYLLSRWDFTTIHGDILSGVYDHYLEPGKRRALGEVFTRPEIARYMLERCHYDSHKTVLDPACGTGTFLVEALNEDVRRLRAAGVLTEQTVTHTLRRLHGLDISPFSVSLAQIQLLWHNIDLFANKSPAEIRALAASIIPAIQVQGGHSSLDTLGVPFAAHSQVGLNFPRVAAAGRRKRVASVSRRFRQILQGTYDIVIGNPPYVRPHRVTLDAETIRSYQEVMEGQVDLYIPFLYRALRGWVRPSGYVSFIVPISVVDAAYAGQLRRVLGEFKIVEIVDLEALRKRTFRGIKRPTVIFVIQNAPGADDDDVVMTNLSMACYDADTDTIDFSRADRSTVKRGQISQSAYHPLPPISEETPVWMSEVADEDTAALLTKVSGADASVLEQLARAPRLGAIVKVVYKKKGRQEAGTAQASALSEVPEGSDPGDWEPYVMVAYGIKLGSSRAIVDSGWPLYKAQNVFPSGPQGNPMGYWDATRSEVDSLRLYAYRHLFDFTCLYAVREVSQLPVACRVPPNTAFQNTVVMVQLSENFPLDIYLMSRVPQWFAIKALRASVIEDLYSHWFKRGLLLLPIPSQRTQREVSVLRSMGERLVTLDKDLANAHRHVEERIPRSATKTLFDLFGEDSPLVAGADLTGAGTGAAITSVHEQGDTIVSDDLFFKMTVPNHTLRRYLAYYLERVLEKGEEVIFDLEAIGAIPVPVDLDTVVEAIDEFRAAYPTRAQDFQKAQLELDTYVGGLLGLTPEQIAYVVTAMTEDGFLKQLRPNFEQFGVHVQLYSDHSEDDRYA